MISLDCSSTASSNNDSDKSLHFIKCKRRRCDNEAKFGGVCGDHGYTRRCKIEGCDRYAVSKGRCIGHGVELYIYISCLYSLY
jgi:hypothetical protein